MITVTMCGDIELCDGDSMDAVNRCLCLQTPQLPTTIERFETPLELVVRATARSSETLVDLVICGENLHGLTALEVLADLRPDSPEGQPPQMGLRAIAVPRIILAQRNLCSAYDAARLEVEGFVHVPTSREAFERSVTRCLADIAREHDDSVVLRCRDGWQRILLEHVIYAQTSNHDQILHLDNGPDQVTRATSAAIFEKMSQGRTQFFKAGSSYVVNLAHVRSVRTSGNIVTFDDGSQISVPVRSRTALEAELLATNK